MDDDILLPRRRRWWDYIELALAAAALWSAFPDVGAWFMVFPAIALLVSVLDRSKAGRATWYGFVFGLGFFLPHIWWATVSVGSYLPWFALALAQALFLALFGLGVALVRSFDKLRTSPLLYAVVIAVLWVGVEQLRGRVPFTGFPWGYLAYSQVDSPLRTLAPWGSEVTIGLVIVAIAVLVRRAFSLVPAHSAAWFSRPLALVVALALGLMPFALSLPAVGEDGSLRVGIIQGNVQLPANETFGEYLKVTKNHVDTTRYALENGMDADVILWGENSLDRDPRSDEGARKLLDEVAAEAGVPMVVGVVRYEGGARYNEALVWYPDGSVRDVYTKQLPVPFGEYIPYRDFLSILSKETAKVNVDMLPGHEPGIIDISVGERTIKAGIGICFEAAYESIFSEASRLGAELLIVPTNNSSFGYTAESTQQLQMVRLRAMSMSKSAMQVSTNGVSAIVRPNGTVESVTGLYKSAWRMEEIPLRTSLTFSAKYGDYLDYAAMGATGLLILAGAIATFRRRHDIHYVE